MIFILASVFAILFYFVLVKPFRFWARKGVQQQSILSQWNNNLNLLCQLRPTAEVIRLYCKNFAEKRYCGGYQVLSPVLYIMDPDLVKQITIQDFDHFVDHNQPMPEDLEPLWAKNLIALKGDRWREMRATLSPSFTSSKMRTMFVLMSDCAKQFTKHFKNGKQINHVDMKDALTRFANDVIASTAFGVTCNSLEERNNEFYRMGMEATNFRGIWRAMKFFLLMFCPSIVKIFGVRLFSAEVSEFFRRLVRTNVESREKHGIVRPDMIQLLMQAKNAARNNENDNGTDEKRQKRHLTNDDLTAQALIFFFAGFESISNFMCFVFYELAVNPDIQERLREEVATTLEECEGVLTYEALLKMKYLDMVISETLRKWPPAIAMDRLCVKPYTIKPTTQAEVEVEINPGDVLWIPVYAIHRNPKYYPNPERFDPERFNDNNKNNLHPYAFLPFGAGPRICIGNRFALLEAKALLFHILVDFEIVVTEKTTVPLRIATNQFNLFSKDGFLLGFKQRT